MFVNTVIDRAGENDERGKLADDHADGDGDGGATRNTVPAPGGTAGDAAGHRADQ